MTSLNRSELIELLRYLTPRERAELDSLIRRPESSQTLSFREYVARVNPRYKWYRHCEVLAEVLQRVADGEIKRLMIYEPPRHGKSEEVSRLFSSYFLWRYPHRWVAISSYGADLAYGLSRASQDFYRAAGGPLASSATAVKHWETGRGGGMWAAGVGGPALGKGWHLGIIDDPVKNAEEAASEVIRNKHKEWYSSTFYTREEPWSDMDPNGALILIQQRWNEDDLGGWLLSEERDGEEPERWHIVNLPAIAEASPQQFPPTCTVEPDWRQPGEALCPERRPIEKLHKIAARIGPYYFGSLFQQMPVPRTGSFFDVSKLQIVPAVPAGLRQVRAWDMAATEGGGNYSVGVKIGTTGDGRYYVTDVVRGQWSTDRRNATILQTARMDGPAVKIRGPKDPGAAGVEAASAFVRMLAGFSVRTEPPSGDKSVRADPFSAQVNAGNVRLLAAPWNREFIEELRQFPHGKYNDQVDAGADAFNELARGSTVAPAAGGQRPVISTYQQNLDQVMRPGPRPNGRM